MATVLGLDAKLFRGDAGTTANQLVEKVKDLSLSLETGESDATTRATKGWRASVATLKSATLEFGLQYDTEDDDYKAFSEAFLNNTPIALFVSDGNGVGLDADFSVMTFNITQNLEEVMSVSVTLKPTASSRAPQWLEDGPTTENA